MAGPSGVAPATAEWNGMAVTAVVKTANTVDLIHA
jgi:hypothetical protein